MREKLIELLSVPTCPSAICNFCRHFKDSYGCEKQKKEQLADHLIAHGVTIQDREIDFDYEAED
jgi:thioredoxin-related protein